MILNGSVEVKFDDKPSITMHLGDAFGVHREPGVIKHKGVMKTRVDDCQVGYDSSSFNLFRPSSLSFCF